MEKITVKYKDKQKDLEVDFKQTLLSILEYLKFDLSHEYQIKLHNQKKLETVLDISLEKLGIKVNELIEVIEMEKR